MAHKKKSCVYFSTFPYIFIHFLCENPIRSQLSFVKIFLVNLQAVQAVRSVASGGKFYQLLPDKENTENGSQLEQSRKENRCRVWP